MKLFYIFFSFLIFNLTTGEISARCSDNTGSTRCFTIQTPKAQNKKKTQNNEVRARCPGKIGGTASTRCFSRPNKVNKQKLNYELLRLLEFGRDRTERKKSINRLIEAGVNVNPRTPLEGLVKKLIAEGANVNAKDKEDITPLMFAVLNNFDRIVNILIQKGADVNARDNEGQTPLKTAIMSLDQRSAVKIAKELIKAGANVNAVDNKGDTLLKTAVKGYPGTPTAAISMVLIENGANVNTVDNQNKRILYYAENKIHFKNDVVIDELKRRGAK